MAKNPTLINTIALVFHKGAEITISLWFPSSLFSLNTREAACLLESVSEDTRPRCSSYVVASDEYLSFFCPSTSLPSQTCPTSVSRLALAISLIAGTKTTIDEQHSRVSVLVFVSSLSFVIILCTFLSVDISLQILRCPSTRPALLHLDLAGK